MSSSYFVGPLVSFLPPFSRVSCIEDRQGGRKREETEEREEKEKGGKSRAHEDNQLHTTLHASDARGEAKKDPRHSRAVPLHLRSYLSRVEGSLEAKRSSRRRSSPHPTNHQPALVCVSVAKGKEK